MAKPRLTLEQHKELGAELKEIRDKMGKMLKTISGSYPKTVQTKIVAVDDAINRFKSIMEDNMFAENPEIASNEGFQVYY